MTDSAHLVKAKEFIAKGDDFYAKAADEIQAWLDEDASRTHVQAAEIIGKGRQWVSTLLAARAECDGKVTQVNWRSGPNDQPSAARRVLRDPEQRRQVLASLSHGEIEQVVTEANEVAIERIRAQRDEQSTDRKPNAGDLMGGDRFDPAESWADAQIVRINERAHTMRQHVEKWGLVLGSLSEQDAFDYLQASERDIAEVRVQLQERIADRSRTEAHHA